MNDGIVLTHLAWYELSLARVKPRPGGFRNVLLQDLTPEIGMVGFELGMQLKF